MNKLIFIAIFLSLIFNTKIYSQKTSNEYNPEYLHTLIEANRQKVLGNFETVRTLYEKCIELNPQSAVAYYELASYYIQQNNYEKAISLEKKAVALSPKNVWYQLLIGILYKQTQQFSKAIKVYKRLIRQNNKRIDFLYELAYLYVHAGKLNKAIKKFNAIEKHYGIEESTSLEKEKIYTYKKKYTKANQEIQKLINTNPNEIRYWGMLAEAYISQNKLQEAERIYKKMLQMDSLNGLVNFSLANFYMIKNNIDKSLYHLKLAFKSTNIDLDSKITTLITLLTYSENNIKISNEIDSLLSILTNMYPENPKVLTLEVDFLLSKNKQLDAYKKLYKICQIDPGKYIIWEKMLMIEYTLGMFDSLYSHGSKAIEYFPLQANLYYLKALAAVQLSKLDEADESLTHVETLPIQDKNLEIEIHALHGDILHSLGKNRESDIEMEKALKLDKFNKYILNNYSYYLSLRSDSLDKAERMSLICVELEPENPAFLDTYAWVLYKQNKIDKALIYIKKAYQLQKEKNENDSTIIEHYGDILYKSGDIEKAIEMWNEALKSGKGSLLLEQKIIQKKLIE